MVNSAVAQALGDVLPRPQAARAALSADAAMAAKHARKSLSIPAFASSFLAVQPATTGEMILQQEELLPPEGSGAGPVGFTIVGESPPSPTNTPVAPPPHLAPQPAPAAPLPPGPSAAPILYSPTPVAPVAPLQPLAPATLVVPTPAAPLPVNAVSLAASGNCCATTLVALVSQTAQTAITAITAVTAAC